MNQIGAMIGPFLVYVLAATAEIAGCFAFWAWLRMGSSPMWLLPGIAALIAFALLLTRIDSAGAGRVFAAYGGVYIVASITWLRTVEGLQPDRWDILGGVLCLVGAGIILLGPRAAA